MGICGIGDAKSENQGAKVLVDDIHQALLWQALQSNAPDGRLWNGRKVADWLSKVTRITISRQRRWEILRQMTFRLRVPRPSHTESNPVEQESWKIKLATEVEELQTVYPEAEIQLWCEDEQTLEDSLTLRA